MIDGYKGNNRYMAFMNRLAINISAIQKTNKLTYMKKIIFLALIALISLMTYGQEKANVFLTLSEFKQIVLLSTLIFNLSKGLRGMFL